MYELYTTRQFERAYKSFIKLHPELKSAIREKLKQLLENPASPALRLHKLSGKEERQFPWGIKFENALCRHSPA